MTGTLFVQLPLNTQAPLEPTGNTPMAAAVLACSAGLPAECILEQDLADMLGDRALVDEIVSRSPTAVAFSLYSWNSERSRYIAGRLRELLPETVIIGGGPEVTRSNLWLTGAGPFDLLVSGEGEPAMDRVLSARINCGSALVEAPVLVRIPAELTPLEWPEPYSMGYLDPAAGEPVLLETVRGCASSCSYCSYRRTHPTPRVIPADDAATLLTQLRDSGGSEIVFLDPTFNARPDLAKLLERMSGMGLECFGEVRGELMTPSLANGFAKAGFASAEIGLQSIDCDVLRRAGRTGDPSAVIHGAKMLRDAGVRPIIDLILGLPGDTPAGAVRSALALRDAGLHENVQVFHLALLPGTEAAETGDPAGMSLPPYYRFSDDAMGGYASAREEMADILGYDLDLAPRPLLFDGWPGTETLDPALPDSFPPSHARPSFRNGSLVLKSDDPWTHRDSVLALASERLKLDPFSVLDIVLSTGRSFPLDLLDMIRALDDGESYTGRTMNAMGREGRLRISVLAEGWREMDVLWLLKAARECSVVLDVGSPSEMPEHLWDAGAYARLAGDDWDLIRLSGKVPSVHQVLFNSSSMERSWCREILDL